MICEIVLSRQGYHCAYIVVLLVSEMVLYVGEELIPRVYSPGRTKLRPLKFSA